MKFLEEHTGRGRSTDGAPYVVVIDAGFVSNERPEKQGLSRSEEATRDAFRALGVPPEALQRA